MIHGIGCDLISLKRFKEAHERQGRAFLERLFVQDEIAYCEKHKDPYPSFAGHFAAKEALSKALGTGIGKHLSWHDMEIRHDAQGKPLVIWKDTIQDSFPIDKTYLSISHSDDLAIAYAVITGKAV
jgi:holo-[acyl-carrier protein] synthase